MIPNLKKIFLQLSKFGLVGVLNTGVDFLVTNILYFTFKPKNMFGLLLISVFAVAVAAINSYFMNKFWTFKEKKIEKETEKKQKGEIFKFAMVSFLGMIVNTSIFLFMNKYLAEIFQIEGFVNINIARLGGVVAAMGVTFLGYRFGVFDADGVYNFREKFSFSTKDETNEKKLISVFCLLALFVRLIFVYAAPVAYGDGVIYNWMSYYMTHGESSKIDWFWHSLFTYWEALLFQIGLGRFHSLVVASLIPGVLLIIPVYMLAKQFFGKKTAVISSLMIVFHPRFVEYSVNGYSETFYICLAFFGIYGTVKMLNTSSKYMSSLAGIGLAGYFLVRNEAIIPVLIIIIIVLITSLKQKRILNILFMLASFSILCILYISFNLHLGNNTGLFQKKTNLTKQYSEQLDLASAAKETYGENKNEKTPPKILEIMRVLIFRFPKNLLYAGERLPGILLSPLILFIAFIWLMSSKKKNPRNGASILWIITLFPFLFYPLIQIEPRHFFIGLTGLQIFGSAGFIVFMNFIAKQTKMQKMILTIGTILLVGGLIPILCLLAWHTEQKRGYHREIGKWIKTNLPENIEIMGDGFGYCNTFWAGIKNKSRIWTENPDKLAEYAKKRQIPILILNEEFLKKANPELIADDINVMKNGINNMTKIKEFSFPKTGRIQIYKLNKKE